MLSYQHAYHAGNPADLHKHIVLAELFSILIKKDRPITYTETHAGRAIYDLKSQEALKTGEAAQGVERITWGKDTPFEAALSATRERYGKTSYPGSPLIAANCLRPEDRIVLMELHPQEADALRREADFDADIHHRDGYEGVLALCPMMPRKGLVLIDPSYEVKTEYDQVAEFTVRLLKKWPEASVLIWYPILDANRHIPMTHALSSLDHIRDEVAFDMKKGRGMKASGLILINPPYGSEGVFATAHKLASRVLSKRVIQ